MSISSITSIPHPDRATSTTQARKADRTAPDQFADMLSEGVDRVNEQVLQGDREVDRMVRTQGANLHETMIALEKADIATRLTAKVGQKLVQAYKEVSQMQV